MKTEVKNYNPIARLIHWLSAIAIIGLFAAGLWMVDLSYYSEWYRTAPHWHKSIGILLAGLTLIRLVWKSVTASPSVEGNTLEKWAAKIVHGLMYIVLLILFTSGYLISTADGRAIDIFDWFAIPGAGALFEGQADLAGEIHFYAAWTLIILAGLHAMAALKHHFIDKDNTLRKMIGASK